MTTGEQQPKGEIIKVPEVIEPTEVFADELEYLTHKVGRIMERQDQLLEQAIETNRRSEEVLKKARALRNRTSKPQLPEEPETK